MIINLYHDVVNSIFLRINVICFKYTAIYLNLFVCQKIDKFLECFVYSCIEYCVMQHNISIDFVGQNKYDVTINLERWFDSIANATADMHYLHWKQMTYAKIENSLYSQSIICFNDIKTDYDKYVANVNSINNQYDIARIDESIIGILRNSDTNQEKIENIKSYLLLHDVYIENAKKFPQIWYDELDRLYSKCNEFINKGYKDIAVHYCVLY